MPEQLTFFDDFARDELVEAPQPPISGSVTAPLTDVPRGHNATRQTSSQHNRSVAHRGREHYGSPAECARKRITARERVLWYVKSRGYDGATREEIAEGLGMRLSSVCGRCSELLNPPPPHRPSLYQTKRRRAGSSGQMQVILFDSKLRQ